MISQRTRSGTRAPDRTSDSAIGKLLQRQCTCGKHTLAGDQCEACKSAKSRAPQRKVRIGASDDPLEREADQVAEQVLHGARVSPIGDARAAQRFAAGADGPNGVATKGIPDSVRQVTASTGTALRPPVQHDMEARFGCDFSGVRVHTDSAAANSAREINARAYTLGRHLVFGAGQFRPESADGRRLLAHELTHVLQQTGAGGQPKAQVQRKVVLKGTEMSLKDRRAFVKAHKWTSKAKATEIIEDMAAADDGFDFKDESELEVEIDKRVATVQHMIESQASSGNKEEGVRAGFGYPFTGASALYGPRVNYSAREFWEPGPPDNYARRTDKKKNEALNKLPRHSRCTVYGDQCSSYSFKLSAKGKADPYHAIAYLFPHQLGHKRTLIHCDYLVSVVNFMSFADAIGSTEFNKRVTSYGPQKIQLRWNAFNDLQSEFFNIVKVGGVNTAVRQTGLGSLQNVSPKSEKDLVVGDHVIFFNHLAYDLINRNIGNAWRLENAVLIAKNPKGEDVFLGHGSGRKTAAQLRAKLAEEFNDVARPALALIDKTKSKNKAVADDARATLASKYPRIKEVGGEWRVSGKAGLCSTVQIDEKLRLIKPGEVLGPKDPCDQTRMEPVQRPVESAK